MYPGSALLISSSDTFIFDQIDVALKWFLKQTLSKPDTPPTVLWIAVVYENYDKRRIKGLMVFVQNVLIIIYI